MNTSFYISHIAPSEAPSNVVLSLSSTTTLSVTWDALPISSRNGFISLYTVYLSSHGITTRINITNSRQASFSTFLPNTIYSVTVVAHTSAGAGPFSNATTIITPIIGNEMQAKKILNNVYF